MEECAEIQQIASKALRFGLGNHHPERLETNIKEIQRELTDLDSIHFMLMRSGVLPLKYSSLNDMSPKIVKVNRFMKISKSAGR
jgi:hypothetical protein